MPDYSYKCLGCKSEFTIHLSMAEREEKARKRQIRCPKCDSTDVKHLIESIFVTTAKKS